MLDLISRQVIGWSMRSRIDSELAINALLMAVWRRNPKEKVIVHSDQGCQYTSHDWQAFLKAHGLESSMSRRGNCYDNAVAESFFQLLKRERIRRKIYTDHEEAQPARECLLKPGRFKRTFLPRRNRILPTCFYIQGFMQLTTSNTACTISLLDRARGGAVWQLVGLITRRSEVQILSPQPRHSRTSPKLAGPFFSRRAGPSMG